MQGAHDAPVHAIVDMHMPPSPVAPGDVRLAGLEGMRGVAALFVVLHHCWLMSYTGFPANNGPWWTGLLVYGHFAVAIFIVLSGFSLAVAPARRGWQVGNLGRFAHRRIWRILPPYWPALIFSLLVAWAIVPQPGEAKPTLRSVVVFGSLVAGRRRLARARTAPSGRSPSRRSCTCCFPSWCSWSCASARA